MNRVLLLLGLALAGCGARIDYARVTPPVGWVAFASQRHVPILEQPMRVAIYRPTATTEIVHFDTEAPATFLQNLGPAGTTLNDVSVVRSALGF